MRFLCLVQERAARFHFYFFRFYLCVFFRKTRAPALLPLSIPWRNAFAFCFGSLNVCALAALVGSRSRLFV